MLLQRIESSFTREGKSQMIQSIPNYTVHLNWNTQFYKDFNQIRKFNNKFIIST